MEIDDIFQVRRKKWESLKQMRKEAGDDLKECPVCHEKVSGKELQEKLNVCPSCGHHMAMSVSERLLSLLDENSFKELYADLETGDPLEFPGYKEKLSKYQELSGNKDAFVCGYGKIRGKKAAIGVLDGGFLMGSMGSVVGEKIARLCEYAKKKKLPLVIVSASGGARMQEGLFSLMQMAKTAAAIESFKAHGGFFLSVLTNPTTGGVSASFANLGDIILAEPDALICFAGPRVIEQTIGQTLPEGFQHAEFLLEHGMIDRIVERKKLKNMIGQLLYLHGY